MPPTDVTAPTAHEPPSSTTLFFAFGGLMASLAAGYGVLFTIVDDYRDDYGISETAIGAVIGIGFLAAFLAQILIAPLADRGHARKVVLFGVAVNVVGLLLMGFSTTLAPIMIGRFISGVGIGAAVPAARRIVILADPDHLGQNLGRLIAADVFGFALGPAVSALLVGPFGIPAPFVVVALATAVLVAFVARVQVEESVVPPKRRLALDLLNIRPFAGAVVFGAALFVMIGSFDALWAVVHSDLGTNEWIANLGITLFALPLIILGPFGGRLAQVHGPFRISVFGLTIGAFFMASYGLLPTGMWIFAFAMLHAVSDGITVSSSGVAVGMVVPPDRQAGAQGVLGAAQALAAGIMAVVTAALYQNFGRSTAYLVCAVVMLVLVATGGWLARSAWSMKRPLHIAEGPVIHDGPTPVSSPTT
jgi:MFS family permease